MGSSSLSSFAHVPLVRVSCAKPRSGLVAPGLLASFSPSSAVQAAGSARSSWTHVRLYASAAARGAGTLSDPDEDEGLDDDVDLVSALESEIEHEDEAEKDGDGSEDEFESLMGVLKSEFGFTLAKDDAGDAEIVLTKKENERKSRSCCSRTVTWTQVARTARNRKTKTISRSKRRV